MIILYPFKSWLQIIFSTTSAVERLLYFFLFNDTFDPSHSLHYLNNKHPNMKFTAESETEGQISFLDININKQDSSFITSIFRKKTFTGLGTNYFSYIPMKFKISSIATLVHRAYHLSSSYINFHNEIKFLHTFFTNNFFPPFLLNNIVNEFLNKMYQTNNNQPLSVPKQKVFVKIPYYGYATDRITSELSTFFYKHLPQLNINFICTNSLSIQSFFKHKERLPDPACSSIIYKFQCLSCNVQYLGSSRNQFLVRVGEHRGVSVRSNLPFQAPPFSVIRQHSQPAGHPQRIKDFKILQPLWNHTYTF